MFTQKRGKEGEKKAEQFLREKGYQIIARNYRTPVGEIDIIAEKNGELVFIEVKKRSSSKFGIGAEAVTAQKQNKIIRSAQLYMKRFCEGETNCRFDVISIDAKNIRHIENAFTA
ncbi:MAG TPA: YraN family protein [Flexistipes sinusarabici]|uniref:UPF0102 protein DHM44_03755 n=1 Tax=Flexistipes sinusarabici TaxID=2352 RepID=A0A3D5QAC0_FLESI|nr:YraN family protein [Flexistipes sinusarabici]